MGQVKLNPIAAPAAFNEILGVLNAQIDECLKEAVPVPRSRRRARSTPEEAALPHALSSPSRRPAPTAAPLQQSERLGELPGRYSALAGIRKFIGTRTRRPAKAALITAAVAMVMVLTVALQHA